MADTRPIFIDIDGTLTTHGNVQWADPIQSRIDQVKKMLRDGKSVVIWSGGGCEYARTWASAYGLDKAVCIGKPEMCVDDNPHIRPEGRMPIRSPEDFFK